MQLNSSIIFCLEAGVFHSSCYDLFIRNISLSLLSVNGFVLGSVFLLFNAPDRVSFWVYRGIETASITHRANPTSTDGWHRPDFSTRCQNDTYFWRISPKNTQTSSHGHGSPQNKLYSVEGGGLEGPFPMDLGFGDELICQKVFCVFCVCLACSEAGWEVLCPACFLPA